ncbi:MAG: DMT family transporter [Gammaproteobacteria bacterium]|nr:DMT family transporter [Gammaproteobacteria bacterium]
MFLELKSRIQACKLSLVALSYLGVVLIWSTTPLAIKWSAEETGFVFAVLSRMLIGAVLALLILVIVKRKLEYSKAAIKVYLAAALSIYGSMQLVYWGAVYIPSGLIAVIFGFAPVLTSLLANKYLNEKKTRHYQWLAMAVSIAGLTIIFFDAFIAGLLIIKGTFLILLAVVLHSSSAVMIKALKVKMSALSLTTGGLLISLPLFAVTWFMNDVALPTEISVKAAFSIVYLAAMGSVVGFVLYYFLLESLTASVVALITLITPVSALLLGVFLNNEVITINLLTGTLLVLAGLVFYQWGHAFIRRTD